MKPIIELKNVYKIYTTASEDVYALNNVTLKINQNDFLGVMGPSGSGKSTLLHVVGLLDEPTKGKIYLGGVDTTHMGEDTRAHLRATKIGFVFQTYNLVPNITVIENVALPAHITEVGTGVAHRRAAKILEKLGLGDRLYFFPNQLSGGQRQRVAIARALVNEPELILADEPTGNLDSKTSQGVLEVFKKLHSEGKTIVIITHDMSISKTTHKTVRIMDGKIKR